MGLHGLLQGQPLLFPIDFIHLLEKHKQLSHNSDKTTFWVIGESGLDSCHG
jgi:hypothetical protein